ncbi:hypothetical protein ACFWUP_18225 [Nocardia sp. NPDC058658]|uniref:DUF7373 family lipoprotein n=1 Tax=Nocardia sp. NPDC058658 TaxID=3346580 RepID=UPI00364F04A1
MSSAFVALGLLLSACGDDTEAATAPPAPKIDITTLDSGNYPTTPVDVEATRKPTSGAQRESIRIGAATPVAVQYDPRFVFGTGNHSRHRHLTPIEPPSFSGVGIDYKDFNAVIPGLVAGWESSSSRREVSNGGRETATMSIRFETPDQAAFAATELSNRAPGPARTIPGYPNVPAKVEHNTQNLPFQNLRAWLARGDMLLFIQVTDWLGLPYDADSDAVVAQRFFDKHLEMLRSYTPTPLSEISKLPLDTEGLLSHVLPAEVTSRSESGTSPSAVYPAQAALHFEKKSESARAAYADAGIDYLAFDAATVFRARDENAATRFQAWSESQTSENTNYVKADSPPNLPSFRCFAVNPAAKSAFLEKPQCVGTFGRYVISTSSKSLQDVHQRISAQYKLLNGFNG